MTTTATKSPTIPRLIALACGLCSLILIYLSQERHLSQQDPANVFMAVKYGMNLTMERPHAPGYPFFVLLDRGISSLLGIGIHSTMLLMNLCFAAASITVLWKLAKRMTDEKIAAAAIALMAFNPLFLFYACTAETYVFDALIGAAVVYCALYTQASRRKYVWLLLGVVGGFRLSSAILMAVVLASDAIIASRREGESTLKGLLVSGAMFLIGIATWLVPFMLTVPTGSSFSVLFFDGTIHPGAVSQSLITFITFLLWTENVGLIVLLGLWLARPKLPKESMSSESRSSESRREKTMLVAWIVLPALYFALRTYSKGYMLLILPALSLVLAIMLCRIQKPILSTVTTSGLAVINLAIFLFFPFVMPPVDLATPKHNLPISYRLEAAKERALSFFLPARSRIVEMDESIEQFESSLREIPNHNGAMFLFDRAAELWIVPRGIICENNNIKVASSAESVRPYFKLSAAGSIDYDFTESQLLNEPVLYYVMDRRSLSGIGCPGTLVAESARLNIYEIPMGSRESFGRFIDSIR